MKIENQQQKIIEILKMPQKHKTPFLNKQVKVYMMDHFKFFADMQISLKEEQIIQLCGELSFEEFN